MKVNYPTHKENTPGDFSDNFRNIKKIVQVDHSKKIMKKRLIFSVCRSQKTAGGRKLFSTNKIKHIQMSDYRVKISDKSDHHTPQNLSSNPTDKKSKIDNRIFLCDLKFNRNLRLLRYSTGFSSIIFSQKMAQKCLHILFNLDQTLLFSAIVPGNFRV